MDTPTTMRFRFAVVPIAKRNRIVLGVANGYMYMNETQTSVPSTSSHNPNLRQQFFPSISLVKTFSNQRLSHLKYFKYSPISSTQYALMRL